MAKGKKVLEAHVRKAVEDVVERALRDEDDGERVPGKVVRGAKTSWTRKDIERIFPICEFTPEETVPVTYNGVMYQLIAGVSMIAPTIIKDIYLDHRRRMRNVGKSLVGIDIYPGHGALEPENRG